MYLLVLNEETGLIRDDEVFDSWKGIKVFRELAKKDDLKSLTVVALSMDYLTPYAHYNDKDRPHRAMEEVFGDRNAFDPEEDWFKQACEKYNELQYNSDLEHERINNNIKERLLRKLKEAAEAEDDNLISTHTKSLHRHEASIKSFNERFNKKEALDKAVSSSGYELSRIENDIKSRKESKFIEHGKGMKNPDKLHLED